MPRSQPTFIIDHIDLTSVLDSPLRGDIGISAPRLSTPTDTPAVTVTVTPAVDAGDITVGGIDADVPMPTRTARCADGNGTFSGLFSSDEVSIPEHLVA